jgi:uncharacterized integral membrane protein
MIHDYLFNIGLVLVVLVVFVGLPYIINQTIKEFNFFGLNRQPLANIIFRMVAVVGYVVIVFIFFFFNMKLLP